MAVYAVAQISIHNPEQYGRYVAAFIPVLTQYGGRPLAAQVGPEAIEGEWPYDKIIVLEFDDRPAFDRWANSPEYQEISKDRLAATQGVVLVVDGLG